MHCQNASWNQMFFFRFGATYTSQCQQQKLTSLSFARLPAISHHNSQITHSICTRTNLNNTEPPPPHQRRRLRYCLATFLTHTHKKLKIVLTPQKQIIKKFERKYLSIKIFFMTYSRARGEINVRRCGFVKVSAIYNHHFNIIT